MRRFTAVLLVAGAATLPLSGCNMPARSAYEPTPEMADVLAEHAAMHAKEPARISLAEARDVPSLVEATYAINNVQGLPATSIVVSQLTQPVASGAAGALSSTLYRPDLAKNTPIIIFFPGGTWATRRDADDDETARQLAARTGFVVLVPRPRLAPQAKFPDIHDDALALYQWARAEMRAWGGDPTRVILAGAGPGANLALSTALLARDRNVALPDGLLLITPWAGTATNSASMSENGSRPPLTRATVRWAQDLYAPNSQRDPRIDLAARTDLTGMPPTILVLADMDPLRSSAEALAAAMQQAGDRVDVRRYAGVTYDFFGLGTAVPRAADAEDDVARALKIQFERPPVASPVRVSRSRARR